MTFPWRRAVRLCRLGLHLATGALLVGVVYRLVGRQRHLALRASWCRRILHVLGVELHVSGALPAGCHVIAANHVSWLDVFVIGAVVPCWFVAKDELAAWPFVGWMARANDTLFLRRFDARAAYRMNGAIRERLAVRESVVIFPEGTTTDGSYVRDFYPALFQPAVDTRMPVLPLALSYRDRAQRTATQVAYINDDPLWLSLRAVLDAPCTQAHLLFDRVLAPSTRRQLACEACHEVRRLQTHAVQAGMRKQPGAERSLASLEAAPE